ncbi:MAG TPA: class I SAM-dependent methyltransferase [Chthoniobacterales bacterium]
MTYDDADLLLQRQDIAIFEVPTSTTPSDKATLLKLQALVKQGAPTYTFLEIGSYRGGALLPHLVDRACSKVISVDKRPPATPDNRGFHLGYEGITTQDMRNMITPHVPTDALRKLITFDADVSEVTRDMIGNAVDLAFIDGEHTNVACFADFVGLYPLLSDDGIIAFHDANLVLDALFNIRTFLKFIGVSYAFHLLPELMASIALGKNIALLREAFDPIAYEEESYVRRAKRELHEQIAGSVSVGAHL